MDRELKPLIEQDMSSILKEIKAPMGVYAVLGNHEGYGKQTLEEIKDFYNKANITLLIDSVVKSNPVVIMGRNDIHKGEDRVGVIEKINSEGFNSNKMPLIILSHKPLEKEEMEPLDSLNNNIIFYISGHTHNGQVYPFSKIVKKMYTHYYGLFTEGKVNYITSSGIGLWGPKVRLGTQSEIVVIDLVGDTSFQLPARDTNAITGSEFMKKVEKLPLQERALLPGQQPVGEVYFQVLTIFRFLLLLIFLQLSLSNLK